MKVERNMVADANGAIAADAFLDLNFEDLKQALTRIIEEWWSRKRDDLARARRLQPLIDVAEAAKLLGIPESTLYDLASRGELPHHRYGKHYRFDPAALIEAGKQAAARRSR